MPEKQNLRVQWKKVRHEYQKEKHEFAEEILGINRFQYYQYENGKKIPTLENAIRLSRKVGKNVEDIYKLPEDPEG